MSDTEQANECKTLSTASCRSLPKHRDARNPNNEFSELGGTVLFYISGRICDAGFPNSTRINGMTPTAINAYCELESKLREWIGDLSYYAHRYGGYGRITRIGNYGSYPAGSVRESFHNTGEALDIAWIQWSTGQSCRPCNGDLEVDDPTNRRRLVAVEASLRRRFGTVLNRGIDNHHDHFHVDTGCPVGFRYRSSKNHRLFARDCIEAFTEASIGYDITSWTEADGEALSNLLDLMGMDCFDIERNASEYLAFLAYIMMHGFRNAGAGTYKYGSDVPVL